MSDIRKTQRSFARKANATLEHRFEDLYHLICRREWIEAALSGVLSNSGAKTPGTDGVSKKDLQAERKREQFTIAIQTDLKAGTFEPSPVQRVWIPKPGKTEKRGLGVPTLRDRVIQELLRMLMEPIWESNFLDCSHGFRPRHRTMDCIAPFYAHATSLQKYFWVIEGDIRKAFDRINHHILMRLVKRRIADPRILALIESFLIAGVMDEGLFQETPEGIPQGGVLSPLLSNIYLSELDQWWWKQFGSRSHNEKRKNRNAGNGNAILTRYADDFCILWNGTREGATTLRDELKQFLWTELHLELSLEKTWITHVNDGLDFLGFHIQRECPTNNTPWIRVTPTRGNVERFRSKIRQMTGHFTTQITPDLKFQMLNRVIRGWGQYYRHVNFSHDAQELDWWTNKRVLIWLRHKHKKVGVRALLAMYKRREQKGTHDRWNFGTVSEKGDMVYIEKLTDIRLQPYRARKRENPYLEEDDDLIPITKGEMPLNVPVQINLDPEGLRAREVKAEIKARDGYRCVRCGKTGVDAHHLLAQKDGGADDPNNLVALCKQCHIETESYGVNRTGGKTQGKAG